MHSGRSTAPMYIVQSCSLYCASSWLACTATNHHHKLESQHLAGARIITRCTRSTPTVPLLKEAGLLPLAVHVNLATAKLRGCTLHHTQETPIANAAARSVEPLMHQTSCRWRSGKEVVATAIKNSLTCWKLFQHLITPSLSSPNFRWGR